MSYQDMLTGSRARAGLIVLILLAILVAVGLIVVNNNAPVVSTVQVADCLIADDEGCIRFPTVTGSNLNGEERTFPADFAGDFNLVILPFDDAQQQKALTWLPLARSLRQADPGFAYYNLPTLSDVSPALRLVIRGGMTLLITEDDLREATVFLFLKEFDLFLDTLGIEGTAALAVLLLDNAGQVLWRSTGEFTEAAGDSLREELARRETTIR
jgi:hypothetical protein